MGKGFFPFLALLARTLHQVANFKIKFKFVYGHGAYTPDSPRKTDMDGKGWIKGCLQPKTAFPYHSRKGSTREATGSNCGDSSPLSTGFLVLDIPGAGRFIIPGYSVRA
jgi:hypothetical protein